MCNRRLTPDPSISHHRSTADFHPRLSPTPPGPALSDFDPLPAPLSPPLAEETARALRLRHLIGVAELGTWELEFATGKVERSERTRRIIGLRPEDGTRLDAWGERIHYADRERTLRAFEVACEP